MEQRNDGNVEKPREVSEEPDIQCAQEALEAMILAARAKKPTWFIARTSRVIRRP
jgi:hypothetical protein